MSAVIISPNMLLPNPIPTSTLGPEWSYDISACMTVIDSHNHSPDQGAPIQPNGLNINDDLSFQGNNGIAFRAVRFDDQGTAITNVSPDVGELYVADNELYYNDVTGGNQVQITNNGSVNAGAGSISGLPSGTASASYNAGTFTWQSATNTGANMDFASAIFRNSTPSSFGLTLQAPTLSSDYALTLPAIPASTKIMIMDNSGNMSAAYTVDNSTIQVSANVIGVKNSGITATQLASDSVTTAKILDANVTKAKLASDVLQMNVQTFSSSGSFVVPAGVTCLMLEGAGAGGGGGAGGGVVNPNSGNGAGGGAGGNGAPPIFTTVTVTPAETLTVTLGTGGAGGTGGSGNGGVGSNGTVSTIAGSFGTITFPAGAGGAGGLGGNGEPAGGAGSSTMVGTVGGGYAAINGGDGGQSNTVNPTAGYSSIAIGGAAAGSQTANGSGAGGGGGASILTGGAGAAGTNASTVNGNAGTAAAAASGAGGGGGSGGRVGTPGSTRTGGNGGAGGGGRIVVRWLGAT